MDNNGVVNKFFKGEMVFENHWRQLALERINEMIGVFPGRKDFIAFYLTYNGGVFTQGADFYSNDIYDLPEDYRSMEVGSFLHIPLPDDGNTESHTYSIEKEKVRRTGFSEKFDDFILSHLPFADNEGDNTFWIDIKTGEVKYTDFEFMGYNPDKTIVVASSFSDFCKRIEAL